MKLIVENTLSDLFTDRYITYRIEMVNNIYDELVSGKLGLDDIRRKSMELIDSMHVVLKEMNKKYKDIYPTGEHRANIIRLKTYREELASNSSPGLVNWIYDNLIRETDKIFKYFDNIGYPFR